MEYKRRYTMKKNQKNEIKKQLDSLDLEGDVEIIITSLQTVMKNHKEDGFFKFSIEKETDYGYGYNDQYDVFYLYGVRLETDNELAKRIAANKKRVVTARKAAKTRAIKKEEREHAQYLKLHAKYKEKQL